MSSASLSRCLFCGHTNPTGAKFCNECGSPLHLKPCTRCEAINDADARACYKCGRIDPALANMPETAPAWRVAERTTASATATDVGLTPGCGSLPEPVAVNNEAPGDERTCDAAAAALEPRPSGRDESSQAAAPPGAAYVAAAHDAGEAGKRRPTLRAAAAVLPPLVLLAAVAVAACYAYLHPLQLREWVSATQTLVRHGAGGTPIPVATSGIGVPAARMAPVSVDPATILATGPKVAAAPDESALALPTSPIAPGGGSSAGADATSDQTPPHASPLLATPQPQVAANAQATPPSPPVHAAKKASSGTKATAKKSKKTATKKSASSPVKPVPTTSARTSEARATTTGK